jgi:hypothetical protein
MFTRFRPRRIEGGQLLPISHFGRAFSEVLLRVSAIEGMGDENAPMADTGDGLLGKCWRRFATVAFEQVDNV